jgi:hypothetical protein
MEARVLGEEGLVLRFRIDDPGYLVVHWWI